MQEGDTDNPFVDRQEESMSLELEIETIGKGNNVEKGVANPKIYEEEEMVKAIMELQTKSLEVTTSVLEMIDEPVERAEESILTI
jgi:hypothetical protein